MTCQNCQKEIKDTVFQFNHIVDGITAKFIQKYTDLDSESYCKKCSETIIPEAKRNFFTLKNEAESYIKNHIAIIPIITLHSPKDWDYTTLEIVSGQSVSGTGLISEIASNWTDFFGMQSGSFNKKLKEGEDLCKAQLRIQTLNLGGNAIIGTDIDYSEAGGGKGMLMVCMAGTAIKIRNLDSLKIDRDILNNLQVHSQTLLECEAFERNRDLNI
ncbi:heavy metal-binding domain-containing protein [Algoriphagus halophytocola]|uniref:YbjQ family protein n=1 Tax=Algoriphagus halophytocola TaxID=2991499 RepID=UPI0022DD5E11|nr:heavy metal-binding domain-containing protein [Algoriphagus sp. TR-M9]WBL42409.1 heavy metal-binding domain-containing protein [Algoriphagus sp. TR-M9]WBL43080.1 heavy metal-binding domain-containing protein [Algoriphagus sp. TR-M9]